ncbi:hypothetical protein B296_00048926 [Ensete ventricosum]|uniref:Bromo domain-containing protein n=1 Tax=Ensete ventricosum TaxID=4639 RepID=A0A426YSV1_ENSVE|nr:hypothetical protein B296_00048926 [Ensete ventricosum]
MARSGDTEEKEIWGTWEELLLACAVNRHGTRRWESVAMEIESRTSVSQLVTPQGCRQRYRDLQRRFGAGAGVVNGSGDDDGGDADPDSEADVPWLEELRRLRVAELRREVERYDISIGSLQLKVKSLQEERERSLREAESDEEKPDHETKKEGAPPGSTPESLAGNRISSGGDSGPSCDQSHSNDPKEIPGEDYREQGKASALVAPGGNAADPSAVADEKAGEGSYNGSTGSPTVGAAARKQAMGDSGESIAESKRGEEGEGEKESSDVQSSASLSLRWRKAAFIGGSGRGEEAAAESRPLVDLLEIFRSDKYGSVFERRLESQESVRYRSLVRQHVDVEMVRAKLDRIASGRSYSTAEFFRDLLLLCSNAVVFFPRDSLESVAAVHLRRLVTKELDATFRTPKEPTPPPPPPQPKPADPKPKPELDLAGALIDKTISSPPPIVSRKRSSISNKVTVAAAKKKEEEKPDPARKESDNEEKSLTTKERTVLSGPTRGLRTSKVRGGKGEGGLAAKRSNLAPTSGLKSKPVDNVAAVEAVVKPDKKNSGGGPATAAAKKQSATSFLNRMKRSSNGTLMEMLKSSSGAGGGREQKKEAKGDARKDQGSRQAAGGGSDSGKKVAEASGGSGKRGVGRPPKRAAAYVTPPPAKRAREEAETAAPSKTPASTSRKRRRR